MEYVSPHYQQTLDNLAESLMAERREKLLAELAATALLVEAGPHIDHGRC